MLYKNINIDALAYELAPEVVSSEELERQLEPVYRRLKLPQGRLELMTGIHERRFWPRGFRPSDGAILAGRKALAQSSLRPQDIGCLVMCSVCRDFLEPATATVVHHALGLPPQCLVFDLSNACLGMLTGMVTASALIEQGVVGAALLVSGEDCRPLLESTVHKMNSDLSLTRQSVKPYFASLTIGSGAAAIALSRRGTGRGGLRFVGGACLADTSHNELCQGGGGDGGTLMLTDAETLLARGVEVAAKTWTAFKNESSWDAAGVDVFCAHQVGKAHRDLLFQTLGLDTAKDFPTFPALGNMGSVSCPATAAMAIEAGRLPPGGRMALLGIGSGINCAMLGIEREKNALS